jgi:Undecaprenyl-phosphate glucose phosphotransferase
MLNMLRTEEQASVAGPTAEIANGRARHAIQPFSLPIQYVEPAVVAIDFILIVSLSVLTGLGYPLVFLNFTPDISPHLAIGVLAFSNFSAILSAKGAYQFHNLANFKRQMYDVPTIWTVVFLILLGVAFSLRIQEILSRGATFGFFIIGLSSLLFWRGILAHLLAKALENGAFAERKIIVIGESSRLLSSQVLPELQRCGYRPVNVFALSPDDLATAALPKTLAETIDRTIKAVRNDAIHDIFLMISWARGPWIDGIVDALNVLPIPVHLLADDDIARFLYQRVHRVGSIWTAELKRTPLTRFEQIVKRTMDIIGASASLILLSPLMLMTAISIRLDSAGPVLFTQRRIGFNGRAFRIYKFRTMTVLEDGSKIRQATRDDPRVTRVGRLIRRASIDELPQLFNVLSGDMSLVGPRPHAAAHDSEYEQRIAAYAFRYHVKPGITGWAQVNGYRGETRTVDMMTSRIECDLWYINNWSIWRDIKIILRTIAIELKFWRSDTY